MIANHKTTLKLITLTILVTASVLIFTHRSNENKNCPIPIFATIPLSGEHSEKGQFMFEAAKLFSDSRECAELTVHDSGSDTARLLDHLRSFVHDHEAKQPIISGIASSYDVQTIIEQGVEDVFRSTPIWSQVVATERQFELPVIRCVFFSATQYLRGLSSQLDIAWPDRIFENVVIAHEPEAFYYREIIDQIRSEEVRFTNAAFSLFEIDPANGKPAADLRDLIEKNKPDILIVLAYDHSFLADLTSAAWYPKLPKVFIYGNIQKYNNNPELYLNSLQSILYDHNFSFEKEARNCSFVSRFTDAYQRTPDFHAAYTYATFEAAFQSKRDPTKETYETIIGTVEINDTGKNIRNYPSYLFVDENDKKTLRSRTVIDLCEAEQYKNIEISSFSIASQHPASKN